MSLQISVTTGKSEEKRTAAGLVRRAETEHADKASSSITELIGGIFEQVKSSIESEANVEVELTGNLELSVKDGKTVLTLDVSGENPNARTLRLKFNTTINPKNKDKDKE